MTTHVQSDSVISFIFIDQCIFAFKENSCASFYLHPIIMLLGLVAGKKKSKSLKNHSAIDFSQTVSKFKDVLVCMLIIFGIDIDVYMYLNSAKMKKYRLT